MRILKDIFHLFYPKICTCCSKNLLKGEAILCVNCRHDLPIIEITDYKDNEIATTFYGRVPIEKAVSFLYYRKKGKARELIHQLKYKNRQEIGEFLGDWFGHQLKQTNVFTDIDFIVPVPLHPKRFKERGYNQVTSFGKKLSKHLDIVYKPNILQRLSNTKTQTLQKRFERFSNTNTKFELTNTSIFKNKHILLIDDVITTGATIEACCNELLKIENITISIATLAYTEYT